MPKSVFAAPFSTPVLTLHAQKSSGVEIGLLRTYPELSVYGADQKDRSPGRSNKWLLYFLSFL